MEEEVRFQTALFGPFLRNIHRGAALDMGCALGCGMAFLERMGFHPVIGFDADARRVESCLRRGFKAILSSDISEVLRMHPGPYSAIMAIDFLEHLPPSTVVPTLRAVYGAMEPGGVFLCRVPNANSAPAGRYRYGDWTHHTSFTETSLDFVLFNAGFRDIAILPAEVTRNGHRSDLDLSQDGAAQGRPSLPACGACSKAW